MSDPNNEPVNKQNLVRHLDEGWNQFHTFFNSLSADQIAQARDANGWSIRDFIVHLACWEQGVAGVLRKQSFSDAIGVDKDLMEQGTDVINAHLRQRYANVTLEAALEMLRQSHDQVIAAVQYLSDDDLMRPTSYFASDSSDDQPIIWLIVGNSFGHYQEHLPWLAAMVGDDRRDNHE